MPGLTLGVQSSPSLPAAAYAVPSATKAFSLWVFPVELKAEASYLWAFLHMKLLVGFAFLPDVIHN